MAKKNQYDEHYKGYLILFKKRKDIIGKNGNEVTIYEKSKDSNTYIGKTSFLSSNKKLGNERAKYWIDNRN